MSTENEIATQVVDAAYHIHVRLGPGLLESAYEAILAFELEGRGFQVKRQFPMPLKYDGVSLEEGFRADLLIDDKVIVELKAAESMNPVFKRQLFTYLKASNLKLGLLINFGMATIKEGIERIIHGNLDD